MIKRWNTVILTILILAMGTLTAYAATETYIQTYVFPDVASLYCPCGGPPTSLSSCEGSNYYGFILTGPSFPYAVGPSTTITVGLSAEKQDPCQAQSNVYVYAKWSTVPIPNAAAPIQNCSGAGCAAPCDALMLTHPDWQLMASVQNVGRGGWDYCPGAISPTSTSVAAAQAAGLTGTLYYLNVLACDEEYTGNCAGGATFADNFIGSNNATTLAAYAYSIPPPPCGPNALCGHISTVEDPTLMLAGDILELRDPSGNIKSVTHSAADGSFSFTGLATGSAYYVNLVLGKLEVAQPPNYLQTIPSQTTADFTVFFVPAQITFYGRTGTMVAVTTSPVVGYAPPAEMISSVIDGGGSTMIEAPSFEKYATFWGRDPVTGNNVKSVSVSLGTLAPLEVLSITSP